MDPTPQDKEFEGHHERRRNLMAHLQNRSGQASARHEVLVGEIELN